MADDSTSKKPGLRILGAGLPRTATTSLQDALETLGFGPCHHNRTCRYDASRSLAFARAYDDPTGVDYAQLLEGFPSAVDEPVASLVPEIYAQMKAAGYRVQIIFSQRSSAAEWWESMTNTLLPLITSSWDWFCALPERDLRCHYTMTSAMMRHWLRKLPKYSGLPAAETRELGPWMYHAHENYIRESIPQEDILFFNAKDGWNPLCSFLGVSIPTHVEYPRVNSTRVVKERGQIARTKVRPSPIGRVRTWY
jgi:hypothetical protein